MAEDSNELVKIVLSTKNDKIILEYVAPEHQIRALTRTHFMQINERCLGFPYECSLSDTKDGAILLTGFASFSIEQNETDGHYQIKFESSFAGRNLVSLLRLPQMELFQHKSMLPTIFCNSIFDYDIWYESVTYVPPATGSGFSLMRG